MNAGPGVNAFSLRTVDQRLTVAATLKRKCIPEHVDHSNAAVGWSATGEYT
jgi:hypothetical protein